MVVLLNGKVFILTIRKISEFYMAELNQPDAHFLVIIKQHNIALLFNNYLNSQGIISFINKDL